MKRINLLFFILLITKFSYSQHLFGVVNSTRAGISGAKINPAHIADSRLWLDINFLTYNAFAENNYIYIPSKHYYITKFFQKKPNWRDYDGRKFKYYEDKNEPWDLFSQFYIQLPSAMIAYGDHAFGLQFKLRQHANLLIKESHISKFMIEGTGYTELQGIEFISDGFHFNKATWWETAASYGYVFRRYKREHWSIGITAKKLFGANCFFFNADNINYRVNNDSSLNVYNTHIDYGYSSSSSAGDEFIDFSGNIFNGSGWAFDLGIIYQKKIDNFDYYSFVQLCQQRYDNYYYKLGVSLLDFGWINYKRNTERFNNNNTEIYWNGVDSYKFNGFGQFTEDLSSHSLNPIEKTSDNFTIFLPTAASLQGDFRIYPKYYVNATLIHPVQVSKISMKMPSVLAFTPRYETKAIEINIPYVIYEWAKPRFGFAVRMYGITIGTDYLNTIFGFRDMTGFDLYVSLSSKLEKGICLKGFSWFFKGKRYYHYVCPD